LSRLPTLTLLAPLALLSGCYASHLRTDEGHVTPGVDGSTSPGSDGGIPPNDAFDPCAHPIGDTALVLRDTFPYRIERTEVTQEAFDLFLSCSDASRTCMRHPTCHPERGPDLPAACISPCEARAYCAWAGRRLCTLSEFQTACEATAAHVAPMGTVASPRSCVLGAYSDGAWDYTPRTDTAQPVESAVNCRGDAPPFDQVYDVLGNVSEMVMVSPMDIGPTALGYSYTSGPNNPCRVEGAPRTADQVDPSVGFRCCADE
jgi:formylglycine-generating enzyme required for sulfatase activity